MFLYSIKSAMVLTMLYLPYMLLLRRESFFRFNRIVLLGILLLSLGLPLCNIPWMSLDHKPVVQAAQLQMLELGIPVHVLPEVQVVANNMAVNENPRFSVFMLVSVIYIMGMIVLLAMRLWQITRLQYGLKQGALWQDDKQGVCIYCHSGDVASFSWMRNIVINEKDYDEAGREIILHEMGHIHNRHSWDVVLLTLVQMLQWWNPLVYVLGISLRDVHEYEADDHVLQQGVSAQGYQLLLIRKAVGSGSYAFANSFNHSLTKKRITMMKKSKSNPWMKSKALYVIPVAALALSAFATPKFVAPIEETVPELEGKGKENFPNPKALEGEKEKIKDEKPLVVLNDKEVFNKNDSIYNVVKERAKFPGGDEECFKFLSENVRYPELCLELGVQGRLIINFVVEKDGSISNVKNIRSYDMELPEVTVLAYKKEHPDSKPVNAKVVEELFYGEAQRVMKLMPKWEPAKDKDGNAVRSFYSLPFMFRLR